MWSWVRNSAASGSSPRARAVGKSCACLMPCRTSKYRLSKKMCELTVPGSGPVPTPRVWAQPGTCPNSRITACFIIRIFCQASVAFLSSSLARSDLSSKRKMAICSYQSVIVVTSILQIPLAKVILNGSKLSGHICVPERMQRTL